MNTLTFTETAKRLLTAKKNSECFATETPQTLRWDDESDGWTFKFQANWIADKDTGELWHDVHVTARKKGERHTFSVWFEKDGDDYKSV